MDEVISPKETEEIRGLIERITYKNEQNGYTVATVRVGRERVTVVGILPFLGEGESAVFSGRYIIHPTYGQQFSADSFERIAPESAAQILRYLSSGLIKGVGPSTAAKIVEKFGANSLDIIQNTPLELARIRGISQDKARSISEEYAKTSMVQDIMMMLSPYEVSPEKCMGIFAKLGKNASARIRENPYLLCMPDIELPFEKAERIAYDLGISPDNEARLSAGIEYIIRQNLMNGHTCLPRSKVINVAIRLLESDEYRIDSVIDRMTESMALFTRDINGQSFVALPQYYSAEEYIAARLSAVKDNIPQSTPIDDLEIDYVENKLGIKFEGLQREAIKQAFTGGILVLTGGPGTGKTTTLNAIIELFEQRRASIELAAPTGRAAKRMTELTGREAKTVHRLLEVEWGDNEKQYFSRNERNPLECDVIIIDEASMLDSLLFDSLLRALRLSCRIILVGDADQLPSVSAGNILCDILSCDKFPAIRLKKVFRQARESLIVTNSHAIINNTPADLSNKGKDFFFMHRGSAYDVCNTVLELCSERLTAAYGFDPINDIQVLCPSRKLDTGTVNLNNILQSTLNPRVKDGPQISYKGIYMREGDKVMQIKNNYDLLWERDDGKSGAGVFNGDVGRIVKIDLRAGEVKVRFDDRVATYYTEGLNELELAYAVTVHKSQGSEFDCVIIPLFDIPSQLCYRNLLYTAVTRAKKMLILVGSEAVFTQMAENDRKTLRYTLLKDFFNEQ